MGNSRLVDSSFSNVIGRELFLSLKHVESDVTTIDYFSTIVRSDWNHQKSVTLQHN